MLLLVGSPLYLVPSLLSSVQTSLFLFLFVHRVVKPRRGAMGHYSVVQRVFAAVHMLVVRSKHSSCGLVLNKFGFTFRFFSMSSSRRTIFLILNIVDDAKMSPAN